MGQEERIAEMLRVMDEMDALRKSCLEMGLTFKSEVVFYYRCERCRERFDDPDECEAHEAACAGPTAATSGQ
jgi:hypothetical protein